MQQQKQPPMTVERNWCQQDSQSLCFLQQRNWQQCSITAMMHKWQTWPAIHLSSYVGLQNCFLTAGFFQNWRFFRESQLRRGNMKQQQSMRVVATLHGMQNQCSLSPPPSSPEAKQNKCSTQSLQQIFPVPRVLSYSKFSSSCSYQASLAKIPSHTHIHPTPVAIHDTNHLPIYSPYVCSVFQGRQLPAFLFHTCGHALNPTLTPHLQVELIKGWHLACKCINLSATCLNEFKKVAHVEPHKTW